MVSSISNLGHDNKIRKEELNTKTLSAVLNTHMISYYTSVCVVIKVIKKSILAIC